MTIEEMYEYVGIDRTKLRTALKQMGKKYINDKQMREEWTEDNPTRNYCYVVSEMVKFYYLPNSTPYILKDIPGEISNHRYLMCEDKVIDLTQDQYDDISKLDYSKGKGQSFMFTKTGISSRAKILKEIYDSL